MKASVQKELTDNVIAILTDEDQYEADEKEAQRLVPVVTEFLTDWDNGDLEPDDIAEFIYSYMNWQGNK